MTRSDSKSKPLRIATSSAIAAACLLALGASGVKGADAPSRIADVPVVTQDERALHFYRDLVQHRLVAINFVFTGCSTVCPLMAARFAALQKQIDAERIPAHLISISLDPANDTPQSLGSWSHKFGATPGWTLVTGEKADIDALTASLGASTADFAAHAPLIVIIDDRKPGAWQRLDGLAEPSVIAQALRAAQQPP